MTVIDEFDSERHNLSFVVMKINTKNKFFGFFQESNSMVPYESSIIQISPNEYLLWFEGLQYHNPNIIKRISGPTHIAIMYKSFSTIEDKSLIQDALNLSGANWRGFNAKSIPVSIYYCKLVADFMKNFDIYGIPKYKIDNNFPWFL